MPITQADVDELTFALAAGEKSVTINGKTITYRSVDEILRARDALQEQVNAVTNRRPRQTMLYHGGRGL